MYIISNIQDAEGILDYIFANRADIGLLLIGAVIGVTMLMWYQKKYKPTRPDDINVAKEMSRLTTELKHSTKAHLECTSKLSSFQVIADELLKDRLKNG